MLKNYKDLYRDEIFYKLQNELSISNPHRVPSLSKIVINMGVGAAIKDSKLLESAKRDLSLISAQKPVETIAKKSEAVFKLRKGMRIGCMVTLRRSRMYDFLERLIRLTMPRVKDFHGFNPNSFDGNGNFAFGIKEHVVFPEIDYNKVDQLRGMDIVIVTSAQNDEHARVLLEKFEMPFVDKSIGV